MCSQAEWDVLRRWVEDAVESEDLRDLVSAAAARIEVLIDEVKMRTCAQDDAQRFRGCRRRSRPQWVV
jgi:hypothetical protein